MPLQTQIGGFATATKRYIREWFVPGCRVITKITQTKQKSAVHVGAAAGNRKDPFCSANLWPGEVVGASAINSLAKLILLVFGRLEPQKSIGCGCSVL